jgi:hypothetical protein
MSSSPGVADGGRSHLLPQKGRQTIYQAGPFASTLAPTLRQKMREEIPDKLFLGLLCRSPNADGNEWEELVADDYVRAPVARVPMSGAFDAIQHSVVLEVASASGVATHVGLFDEFGELIFYGFLSGYRRSTEPARRFEFRAFDLKLKRVVAPVTSGPRPQLGGADWDSLPAWRTAGHQN